MDCHICGREAVGEGTVEGAKVALCDRCVRYAKRFTVYEEYLPPKPVAAPKQAQKTVSLVEDYARKIKSAREKKGLSREGFAKKFFIGVSDIAAFGEGRLKPVEDQAKKIEYALGISLFEQESIESIAKSERLPKRGGGLTLADVVDVKKN